MRRLVWTLCTATLLLNAAYGQNLYEIRTQTDQYYQHLKETSPTYFNFDATGFNDYQVWLDTQLTQAFVQGGDLPATQQVITDYIAAQQEGGTEARSVAMGGNWTEVGPAGSTALDSRGRLDFVSVSPQSSTLILTGSAVGGIYYSDDGGASWKNGGMDTQLPQTSASDCIVHLTNSDVWFCATGDRNAYPNGGRNDVGWTQSFGIYRTLDRGASWNYVGLNDKSFGWEIYKILFNPSNPNIIYAATSAGLWETMNAMDPNPKSVKWTALLIEKNPLQELLTSSSNQVHLRSCTPPAGYRTPRDQW